MGWKTPKPKRKKNTKKKRERRVFKFPYYFRTLSLTRKKRAQK